jgi:hypothetical protein
MPNKIILEFAFDVMYVRYVTVLNKEDKIMYFLFKQ